MALENSANPQITRFSRSGAYWFDFNTVRVVGFVVATAAIAFGSTDDSLVQQVPAACVPPVFGDPPIVRPIDHATNRCDLDGEPSATNPADQAKQEAQNRAKNEFCAWQNTDPALVTRFSFDQLQKPLPAGFPWGSRSNLPTAEERKAIREFYTTFEGDTFGEGSCVHSLDTRISYSLAPRSFLITCGDEWAKPDTYESGVSTVVLMRRL